MIEIRDLNKKFGKKNILSHLSLQVEDGTIQALLGANGAGKSTLIYSIADILKYQAEKIEFDRERTGFVFDKPIFIEKFSAKEYLDFVASLSKIPKVESNSRINDILTFLELPIDNKKYIEEYSKGMKAKVSIAATLLNQPKNLILDEPFDGVDFISVQKICALLKKMAGNGCAILVTSHQFDIIADLGDKFALLKDGKIQFNASAEELKETGNKLFPESKNPVKTYLEQQMLSEGIPTDKFPWL